MQQYKFAETLPKYGKIISSMMPTQESTYHINLFLLSIQYESPHTQQWSCLNGKGIISQSHTHALSDYQILAQTHSTHGLQDENQHTT